MAKVSTKALDKCIAFDLQQSDFGQNFLEKHVVKYLINHSCVSYIYLVLEKASKKQYVLKVIERDKYDVDIKTLKQIKHPGIVDIIGVEATDKYTYLLKEYIKGTNLEAYIEKDGYMREEQVINITEELCNTISYLHTLDPPVIFRDLKPANIMLTDEGEIKLIDIDSLRKFKDDCRKDTVFIGTEGYAAPEQFGFSQTDERTDIYTLGTTMYYLLTGQPPVIDNFRLKDIRKIRLDLSMDTYQVIKKSTMFSPKSRYQNIKELQKELVGHKSFNKFMNCFAVRIVAAVAILAIITSLHIALSNRDPLAGEKHRPEPEIQGRVFYNLGLAGSMDLSDMSRMPVQLDIQEDIKQDKSTTMSSNGKRIANHLEYVVESPKIEPTEDGAIKINYPNQAVACEYSYNYVNWHEYKGPVQVIREGYIYIRSKMPDGSYVYNSIFIDSLDPIEHQRHQIFHRIYPGFEVASDWRRLNIYYPKNSVIREYSFDSVSWIPYEEPLIISESCYVFYRAVMPNGNLIKGRVDFSSFEQRLKSDS